MTTFLIMASATIPVVAFLLTSSSKRRRLRRESSERKLRIAENSRKTIILLQSIRERFPDYVFFNILTKIRHMFQIISRMDETGQDRYHELLYKMTYETMTRLGQDFYNIRFVISPLNNLLDEINKASV